MAARITELFANPAGTDRGQEWVEMCADSAGATLADYALRVGTRTVRLAGTLPPRTCRIARTGSATLRNREPEVSLLYKEGILQQVRASGDAPEGAGWQVIGEAGYWATSTPGIAPGGLPGLPPLLDLPRPGMLPALLGTAACTAGLLTSLALAALRHARDRHYARQGDHAATRR